MKAYLMLLEEGYYNSLVHKPKQAITREHKIRLTGSSSERILLGYYW